MDQPTKHALDIINNQVEEQEEVQEIVLDQAHFQKFNDDIKNTIEKHNDTLLFLSLNDCGLTSLANFPRVDKLIRLELTDNKFSGDQLQNIAFLTELQSLSLGGNPINNFSDLNCLSGLKKLVQLDLFGCPISKEPDYRQKIFSTFTQLKILDNQDAEGKEVEYDDDEEEDEDEEGDEYENDEEEGEGEEGNEEGDEEDGEDEEDDEEDEEEQDSKKKVKKH